MARVIFENDFNAFGGSGFAPEPEVGQLDSDIWSVTGLSDGDLAPGGTEASGDFARGLTGGGVRTGGIYGLELGGGDRALMWQAAGSDLTPGTFRINVDTDGVTAEALTLSFDALVLNDQDRANTLVARISLDGGLTFLEETVSVTSPEAAVAGVVYETTPLSLTVEGAIDADTDLVVELFTDDVSGGGARDEIAIDNLRISVPEDGGPAPEPAYTLELLHVGDQEAGSAAVFDAPRFSAVMNALEGQDLFGDGVEDNTIRLSSGDAIIPSLFFRASEELFGAPGVGDMIIQNELGFEAIALGNHEFDLGTQALSDLIDGTFDGERLSYDVDGVPQFDGTDFPYLSANLDFSTDPNLAPLAVPGTQSPMPRTVTSSVVLEEGGELIGVVGATTPTLAAISSPGDLEVLPDAFAGDPTPAQLDALAAIIQAEVDQLLEANEGMNKVILLSHMQQIAIEQELAQRLSGVDIIVAGGSNTRLLDDTDRLRDGDTAQGQYPLQETDVDGNTTLVVNTDGSYKYVGRLVIGFDEEGRIIPETYDADVSGAYATDDQGVRDMDAEDLVDPEVQAVADAIGRVIVEQESNVFGVSDVYLDGRRSEVRTEETNLGNLTADANLAIARQYDDSVVLSIKNAGGIRADIGQILVPPGGTEAEFLPTEEIRDADGNIVKPEGGISQNDIANALAFNNSLTLLTLSTAQLAEILEYGVAASAYGPDGEPTNQQGRFPQVSGVQFSFDPAAEPGDRIQNAGIFADDGTLIAEIIRDGEVVDNGDASFRVVTLNFLASGGDGYPFPSEGVGRVDLPDVLEAGGVADFAPAGTEQDALAEYLAATFLPSNGGAAFGRAEDPIADDTRIQNLAAREDTVFGGTPSADPFVLSFEPGQEGLYTLDGAFERGDFDFFGAFTNTDNGARDDFSGLDGDQAIFAQDLDGAGGAATRSILIEDIDLGGFAMPELSLLLGALDSEPRFSNYEDDDGIAIYASIDGGEDVLITQFRTDGAAGDLFEDTDLDGIGDGARLASRLAEFSYDLPEGQSLDLRIELTSNDGFEPLVVDYVRVGDAEDTPTGGTIDDDPTLISTVQGEGDSSAIVGETVVIEGIVTGDFQTGDADTFRDLGGFFLMEEEGDRDSNALTSEGIFAHEGEGGFLTDVAAGDRVRVLGTVVERFGKTTIEVTEIRMEGEAVLEDVLDLAVSADLPGVANREALESMLVDFEPLTWTESFDYEEFGEATFAAGGPVYQYTQLFSPDQAGFEAYQQMIEDRTIIVDDGTNGGRGDFDPILKPDGTLFTAGEAIRMGQEFDLTGIFDYDFGAFRLRLPQAETFEPVEAPDRPLQPRDVGSDFKVGSLNVLNYFTTLDQGGNQTANGSGPRGANTLEEFDRQSAKLVEIIEGMDSDVIALNEIENNFAPADDNEQVNADGLNASAIVELVNRLNAAAGEEKWAYVDPGRQFVGTDAIAVGFIYDQTTTRIAPGTEVAVLTDDMLAGLGVDPGNPVFEGPGTARVPLAVTFEEIASGGRFTAAANHFKSKGSVSPFGNNDSIGDGQGNNTEARVQAAQAIDAWLESNPTGSTDADKMILGDLNSYAMEDPLQVLADAGFTNLVAADEGFDSTSYRFSGQVGTLDYALANAALSGQVTGATIWDINDEEPVFFDYNTEGTFVPGIERPTDQGLFDGDLPARGSDHDPVVVGLDLDPERLVIADDSGRSVVTLVGTDADEILLSGEARIATMFGGGGADVFAFQNLEETRQTLRIGDYDAAEGDLLDLGGQSVTQIRQRGDDVIVELEERGDRLFLTDVDADELRFADGTDTGLFA